jgi:predicted nucleic acid-binding protein
LLSREQISLLLNFKVVPVDRETFLKALEIQERYGLSLWNAQIIASARLNGARKVLIEDMQDTAVHDEVLVINPFK